MNRRGTSRAANDALIMDPAGVSRLIDAHQSPDASLESGPRNVGAILQGKCDPFAVQLIS
jgi:hypothetical protein